MDYLYENLGDERFQEFCAALIAKDNNKVQSFPVGQPDGGRDIIVYKSGDKNKSFKIFQVKFVREPYKLNDPYIWLKSIIEGERKKIFKLIQRGGYEYYIITNVRGTAHLDVGTKDKVNELLKSIHNIPAYCWWRDDLNMLFEKDPIFKWSFPEILNGKEILNSALFSQFFEHKVRKEAVIKAYLTDQYVLDNDVKFKQIDLQSKLFDLYTDIPIKLKKWNENDLTIKTLISQYKSIQRVNHIYNEFNFGFQENESIDAAHFLLNYKTGNSIAKLLIEGGPGQGKSTITQYLCQVHRARLLDKQADLDSLPKEIVATPIKLPFKIDLRHVASWVEKSNPYESSIGQKYFSDNWNNSLEAFLLVHIYYHSKIPDFTAIDLLTIFKSSSVFIVFDGFDEIANLDVRKEVIEFINEGLNRLSSNSLTLQVIITSRPAVFSDSVGFSVDEYPHFELTDITPKFINGYVNKWTAVNRLDAIDTIEIKKLVDEKLKLPHLRDLAKSPMQLAIFITLIRTKGEALPNKRTALYDSYIGLFFDRESEKNITIRDNRDLIISIHQYLAWILHSEAELFKTNGTIQLNVLIHYLKSYLNAEGHDPNLAEKLFNAVKDRVCALASRVQGTFEFEVQTLREFFCGKYLYNTAPYSPAGNEKSGTLPDRFDAISKNHYWQNVTRFYSGCFSKGELSMLLFKLEELYNDELFRLTSYPQIITSHLLSDYVFAQYPILLRQAVDLIINNIRKGSVINFEFGYSIYNQLILPSGNGQEEIVDECFQQLKLFPQSDYAIELISLINLNSINVFQKWYKSLNDFRGSELIKWIEYGVYLKVISKVPDSVAFKIFKTADTLQRKRFCQLLFATSKINLLLSKPEIKTYIYNSIIDKEVYKPIKEFKNSSVFMLNLLLNPNIYANLVENNKSENNLVDVINGRFLHSGYIQSKKILAFEIHDELDKKIRKLIEELSFCLNMENLFWDSSIYAWNKWINIIQHHVQDCWKAKVIINLVGAVKGNYLNGGVIVDSSDSDSPLNQDLIFVLKVKNSLINVDDLFTIFENENDKIWQLLVLITWSTPQTLLHLIIKLDNVISNLNLNDYSKLIFGLNVAANKSPFTGLQFKVITSRITKIFVSNRIKYLLSMRMKDSDRRKFIYESIDLNESLVMGSYELRLDYLIRLYLDDTSNEILLSKVKAIYDLSKESTYKTYFYNSKFKLGKLSMPFKIAKMIMEDSISYPRYLVGMAEFTCRLKALDETKPVGLIAQDENWF